MLLVSAEGSLRDWKIQGVMDRNSISRDLGYFILIISVLLRNKRIGGKYTVVLSNYSYACMKTFTHFSRPRAGKGDGISM